MNQDPTTDTRRVSYEPGAASRHPKTGPLTLKPIRNKRMVRLVGWDDGFESRRTTLEVLCTFEDVALESDRVGRWGNLIDGVRATCQRCLHSVDSFGTSERSYRRCLVEMRNQCPRKEDNFYVEGSLQKPAAPPPIPDVSQVAPTSPAPTPVLARVEMVYVYEILWTGPVADKVEDYVYNWSRLFGEPYRKDEDSKHICTQAEDEYWFPTMVPNVFRVCILGEAMNAIALVTYQQKG